MQKGGFLKLRFPLGIAETEQVRGSWFPFGVGIDVHKEMVWVCVLKPSYRTNTQARTLVKFGTSPDELDKMRVFLNSKVSEKHRRYVVEATSTYHFPILLLITDRCWTPITRDPPPCGVSGYRLFVEYLNGLPNAVTASGPPRNIVPEFREFQRATELLQILQDQGDLRFLREEKLTEVGGALPAESVTAAALVEAAKNGYEYRPRPDKSWILVRPDRRLLLKINPMVLDRAEVQELCRLLHLKPGQPNYDVTVGGPEEPFPSTLPPQQVTEIHIIPRSVVQALFYLSHGVLVPPEHLSCGLVPAALEPDGSLFDWQQVTAGLFTVHSARQHCRPPHAYVAVKYRDYWFYIDDRDSESKRTFSLMLTMTHVNLLGVRKGGPALTLPVGR